MRKYAKLQYQKVNINLRYRTHFILFLCVCSLSCEICHIRVSKCVKIRAILPFGKDINQQLCVFKFDVDQEKIIAHKLNVVLYRTIKSQYKLNSLALESSFSAVNVLG